MQPEAYQTFVEQLAQNLQADPRVLGLVLLGSTANMGHAPDQWSDHDFFVITASGVQEQFRTSTTWLPDHDSIVMTVRETKHGLKILYKSGHLLEYAVFDLEEIKVAKVNDYAIVFDRGGIADALRQIATREPADAGTSKDTRRDEGMFLCLLVVGAGRVARGEVISGQVFIRTYALGHLLPVLADKLPAPDKSLLDNLDPYRRFEQVFPQIGEQINAALACDPIHAALGLLNIYNEALRDADGYPADAVITVRNFLLGLADQAE